MTNTPLIAMLVIGIGLSFVFGTIANRLRVSPIAGYLLAGVAIGPFTPGFIADPALALQLADVGVILLMFGVGLHFSLTDLRSLRKAMIPAVAAQMVLSGSFGAGIGFAFGWSPGADIVFGLALSVSSTVVLLRGLQNRRLIETERGRLAISWLVVQDFITVMALVLIPAVAPLLNPGGNIGAVLETERVAGALALTLGKLAAFIVLIFVFGRRIIPWVLHYVAHSGSRELFRLAVLSIALGVAFAATEFFGVSFALGAFLAGMILSESQLSARAAEESLPLRDAFAVLFFVSIGMLFNPAVVVSAPAALALTVLAVVTGNGAIAFALTRLLGYGAGTAVLMAAGLAQIGEFSFVLADLGISQGLLTPDARDLILGASILSILINPFLLALAFRWHPLTKNAAKPEAPPLVSTAISGHTVLVGCGRVGRIVESALETRKEPFLVIEDADKAAASLRERGVEVIAGNAVTEEVLSAANIKSARRLFIAIPNSFEAGQIVEQTRTINPGIEIIARAHSDDEVQYLLKLGANTVIMGEREIAHGMIDHAFGRTPAEAADKPPAF